MIYHECKQGMLKIKIEFEEFILSQVYKHKGSSKEV